MERVAAENEEALAAWDGVLFDRFVKYRDLITTGLGAHGEEALRLHPPLPGERALDIGCGFGDTTQRIAELVGPQGEALGVDIAERFVEAAREEAHAAGISNAGFEVHDVQTARFPPQFDYAFSRFGTMFFANPVAALRNVHGGLVPGGRLCMVVWRRKLDNEWLHRAELVVGHYLEEPEESDASRCGPGPFSMADADTTSDILFRAGFREIEFRRCDIEIKVGHDLEHAVEFAMALGPAAELIRLVGEEADAVRPRLETELTVALSDFAGPDGVIAPASTWIVSARAPGPAAA